MTQARAARRDAKTCAAISTRTPFSFPFAPYPGFETPIEVEHRKPPPRFAARGLRRMLLVDEWEWVLFRLCWPNRHQPEHLMINVGGKSGDVPRVRYNETFSGPNGYQQKHQLLRQLGDVHAAHDWLIGIGPEPLSHALPVLPVTRDPCLLLPSNRRAPNEDDCRVMGRALGRSEIASVNAAKDRVVAVALGIDPDRYAHECALRRDLEQRAVEAWLQSERER